MIRSDWMLSLRAIVVLLLGAWVSLWVPAAAWGQFPPHVWSERFGGDGKTCDEGHGVAVDGRGNFFVTGFFEGSVDFGGGPISSEGYTDAFIAKRDATGAHVWSVGFGDAGQYARGLGVATDAEGCVVVTGKFGGDVDFGSGPLVALGSSDVFVVKLDADGEHIWSRRFGGEDVDIGNDVDVDGDGNVFVTGQFRGVVDFGGGPLVSAGNHDIFVAKLSANGAHLWSRRYGGPAMDLGNAVAADGGGDAIVTGSFQGVVDFGGGSRTSAGYHDIFLLKLDAYGNHAWSHGFGGAVNDHGHGVAVDGGDNVLVTGEFRGTADFGGGPLTSAGNEDIFVARYNAGGTHQWSRRFGDAYFAQAGFDVAADADGGAVVTGWFWGTADLGGGMLVSAGEKDAFIAKYDTVGAHQWSGRFGDTGWDAGFGLDTDGAGNVAVTGAFEVSVDFGGGTLVNPGGPSFGCTDIFVVKYGPLSMWVEGPDRLPPERPGAFEATVSGGEPAYTFRWYKAVDCDDPYWQSIGDDTSQLSAAARRSFCIKSEVSDGAGDSTSRVHHVQIMHDKVIPLRRTSLNPSAFALKQNVPNPFNPDTRITFDLPKVSRVSLAVYDVKGREVARLVDGSIDAGTHTVSFNADHLVSGIHFYRLVADEFVAVNKMIVLK
jgi:hypothetical protein